MVRCILPTGSALTMFSLRTGVRSQIAELKVALEHAQTERKRMIGYDSIAERINTFPSRDELLRYIR